MNRDKKKSLPSLVTVHGFVYGSRLLLLAALAELFAALAHLFAARLALNLELFELRALVGREPGEDALARAEACGAQLLAELFGARLLRVGGLAAGLPALAEQLPQLLALRARGLERALAQRTHLRDLLLGQVQAAQPVAAHLHARAHAPQAPVSRPGLLALRRRGRLLLLRRRRLLRDRRE
jgi:hypothetical protein